MVSPPGDPQEALAQVRREFAAGLPERIAVMRTALATLAQGFDKAAAETFFQRTHSLKGTAASYGAAEVAEHAATLTEQARAWVRGGGAPANEVTAVAPELERLAAAVERYRARVAAGEER